MRILYLWSINSLSHKASLSAKSYISKPVDDLLSYSCIGNIKNNIWKDGIAIIPIENNYTGPIYSNVYGLMDNNCSSSCKIIGELSTEKEESDGVSVTKYWVLTAKDNSISYSDKQQKITLFITMKARQWILYKCLWAFANQWINITKIESLPKQTKSGDYIIWVDIEWKLSSEHIKQAIFELKKLTNNISILWEY